MTRNSSLRQGGFTLFEALIALAVFMLAVTGLAVTLDTALQAALQVRQRSLCRWELESRLAYSQANPPPEASPRIIEAERNHGIRVEESLATYPARNAAGTEITGLKKLTIVTRAGNESDRAVILINRP